MGIFGRTVFREICVSACLGTVLFTFVLFLQKVSRVFEILVRGSADWHTVAYLLSLLLPAVLVFTIPIGVLVGVLIALNRISSDGEIIALRAAGVPSRRLLTPVLAVALLGFLVTGLCSTVLNPWATREEFRLLNQMIAAQLTAEIQPRVFEEQFPNLILYVQNVQAGRLVRWTNVFMADLTEPKDRKGSQDQGDAPIVTVADSAIAVPDVKNNQIHLAMENVNTYEVGKEPDNYYKTQAPHTDQILDAQKRDEKRAKSYTELDMGPLYKLAQKEVEARIEFHQRLALPLACVLLALVGVPLGVSSRKGGKSAAFVLTVLLALGYYTAFMSLTKLAQQRTLPAWFAVWLPDLVLACFAAFFLARLERPGDRDLIGSIRRGIERFLSRSQQKLVPQEGRQLSRLPVFAQIIDTYVLSEFVYYFLLMLVSFVLMVEVFNFFELLSDMFKHHIPMSKMFAYLVWLAPKLTYDSAPMSVLVAVLITFGIMTKQNEITAFKASGVSLHRLALPVIVICGGLSMALFAFDYELLPAANVRQETLRDEIKGRPTQTYLRPDRKWIRGEANRIYYYKILEGNEMLGVSVYDLEPHTNKLRRHISAERARWEPALKTWVFQNGWMREIDGKKETNYRNFVGGTMTFAGITEQPSYFLKEVKQDKQMNFRELAGYIRELRQSGFDTVRLQVQLHRKFAMPLFAMIMSLIAIPFAFGTGNRGAMTSVGVSFIIAICYWTIVTLFEQIGNVNQLPAALAAWSPDLVFALAGMYFLARMRT